MPRPSPRPLGPRLGALLTVLSAAVVLAACGGSSSAGGHDSPEAAAQGFLTALGAFDGSPDNLQKLLDWVPPSKRSSAQQSFGELGAAGGSTRFKLSGVQVGNATVTGDSATVTVQATLAICVSGSVGTQTFSTCPPAPISPTGSFDTLTCVREQGQWYVADYSSTSAGGTGSPAPPTPYPAASASPAAGST